MSTQPSNAPPGPRVVGDYTLLSKIGEGGMGVVHLARHLDGRRVALKVLRPHIVGDDEARRRLAREVSSLERVRSPRVSEILDADPWAEIPYVATRYVPGLSLHDHVLEEGPVAGRDLRWLAGCLAEGLAAVHAVGVLHRDVKPSNVLMEGRTPVLIDFGLARVADDPRLTHTGWLLGTPGYLAPEILYGDDASPASDVHSWAATVAYAALARPPFGRGPAMAVMDRVRRGEHDLDGLDGPEGADPSLRPLLEAALDPDPTARPDLDQVRAWLSPGAPLAAAAVPAREEDPFTIPLAIAGRPPAPDVEDDAVTARVPADEEPRTRRYTQYLAPAPVPAPAVLPDPVLPEPVLPEPTPRDPAPPTLTADPRRLPPPAVTDWERAWDEAHGPVAHEPPRPGLLERSRRAVLLLGGAVATGALVAAAPYLGLVGVALVVWLLRSGSLAGTAAEQRRSTRGRKWFDAPQLLLATPWHLLQAVPGAVILLAWSAGLALAAGLVCFAVAAGVPTTVFVSGVVLAAGAWWGPGGSRLRSPVGRLVDPLARSAGPWVAAALLLAVLAALAVYGAADGASWAPADHRPFRGIWVR